MAGLLLIYGKVVTDLYKSFSLTKILFVLHFPPPVHGSAVVGRFLRESKLINDSFDCRYINLGTSTSVEDIGRTSLGKYFRYLSLLWQVKKHLLLFRPKLCYITPTSAGPGFFKDAVIIILVKIFGIRTICHFHNKGVSVRQERLFDNLLYRIVFGKSYVILLSKYLYSDIQKYLPEESVYYCPNGIPPLIGNYEMRTNTNCEKLSQLLFLSHLIESKGLLVLIDALRLLRDKGCNFYCNIAGGNAELTQVELERIIRDKQLSDRISVLGPRHGDNKIKLLTNTDIFVHPTYNDCLPLVILEAMQFSLPVVSTFEGAIPDVVEDGVTGFLVPQKDPQALADKIEILLKDPDLRQKMGSAGRTRYEAQFTLERFEHRIVDILNTLT